MTGPIGDPAGMTLDELARAQGRIVAEIAWRRLWDSQAREAVRRAEQEPWLGPARPDGTRISRNGQVRRVAK